MKLYKQLWITIKGKLWYLFLLLFSSIYVWHYWQEICESSTFNARNLIFILWLILLIFPLFSEIEFMGIKVKKEVEKAKEEVKSSLQNIQAEIMQLQLNNSIAANINIGYGALPSEQKLEELLKMVRDMQSSDSNSNTDARKSVNPTQGIDKAVYLFKSRLGIEIAVRDLCEKLGYEWKLPVMRMVQILLKSEVINGITSDLISQVYRIANRGIHGEIVSDKYIMFVKETYPEIQRQLTAASDRLHHITCPNCKYSGYSTYDNVCPQCGTVFHK